MNRLAVVLAGVVSAVLVLTGFGPPDPDGFTDAELAASITPLELNVTDVASTTRDGEEEVIRLQADILFAFGKATLSERARARIRTLVDDVPRKARMSVAGHTDSVGSASSNQELSTARARAAASVIRAARPDLKLTVAGYGESRPVAPNASNGKDDPEGRAKNRRVELRYRG